MRKVDCFRDYFVMVCETRYDPHLTGEIILHFTSLIHDP